MNGFWDDLFSGKSGVSGATTPFNTQLKGLPDRANVLLNRKVTPLAPLAHTTDCEINRLAVSGSAAETPPSRHFMAEERLAIQWEVEQPPDPDPSGTAGVPWPDDHLAAARALLQAIREAGMYARIDDLGRLRVGPSSMLWDSDRRTIARYRDTLVDILRAEGKP
jgi:hypothetical protein